MIDVVLFRSLVSAHSDPSCLRCLSERFVPTALFPDMTVMFLGISVACCPSPDPQPYAHA